MHVRADVCIMRPMTDSRLVEPERADGRARNAAGALLRAWAPPALVERLRARFGSVRWSGDYRSWSEAMAACRGYAAEDILSRVKRAATAVKEGRAAHERDGVVSHVVAPVWPLVASLLWIASTRGGRLYVLDFGGSLGSSYQQHKGFLAGLGDLRWDVVEQPHFVECGRDHFADDVLRFHSDIDSCVRACHPDVALLSSVLPYVEAPYAVLDSLVAHRVEYLLLDRTPFIDGSRDRLTVQRVAPRLGAASYPAWFFSRKKLDRYFEGRYRLVEQFDGTDNANIRARFRGLLFQRLPGSARAR